MSWSALERHLQPYFSPRWLEAFRVRRTRQKMPRHSVTGKNFPRRLFIDVSVISKHDAGTGIQRMVRAVATQLLQSPPAGWEIQPVCATRKRLYHPISWCSYGSTDSKPIEPRQGDVFLGLDFSLDTIRFHRRQLTAFKKEGGKLWFVMYDLLPLQRSEWFSDRLVVRFRTWLAILAGLADGFYCISPPVETELRGELAKRYGLETGFETCVLPMGANLAQTSPSTGLPCDFETFLPRLKQSPTILMVGTLEPRKGHADVLAAFNVLWQRGCDCNLVIVGRPGWKTDALQTAVRNHPKNGQHLYWLEDASDEALSHLYGACDGVIIASYAEGFGLPLIEALGYGKYVLARDLPIFRLHETLGVVYFPAEANESILADSIQAFVLGCVKKSWPQPEYVVGDWRDSAVSIIEALA